MTPSDSNPAPLTFSQAEKEEAGMIAALRRASSIGVKVLENQAMKEAPDRDAILVMAFGTTYSETLTPAPAAKLLKPWKRTFTACIRRFPFLKPILQKSSLNGST